MTEYSSTTPSEADLKALFSPYDSRLHPDKYLIKDLHKIEPVRAASVLVPLFYKNGDLHILLTLRSSAMSSFAGHVACPGGMKDEGDADVIETALRETEEEVGITKDLIKVICVLPPMVVSTMTVVTPVLALLSPNFNVIPNTNEVSLVFDLPLKRFVSEHGLTMMRYDGFVDYNYKDDVGDQTVNTWGFTGALCLKVAIVALQSDFKMHLSRNRTATKDSCFNMDGTNAFVQVLIERKSSKL